MIYRYANVNFYLYTFYRGCPDGKFKIMDDFGNAVSADAGAIEVFLNK